MTTRRKLLGAAIAAPAVPSFGLPAFAQERDWPRRLVRFVISSPPGGSIDLIGRMLAEQLEEIWGQSVMIENRGGAGGALATRHVARATPDGYTALVTTASFAINLSVFRTPGYAAEEFLTAAIVAGTPNLFLVRGDSPIRTLGDLVEAARRRPVNYGTPGVGTVPHLLSELLFRRAGGTDTTAVPFVGAGAAVAALLAGNVDMVGSSMPPAMPLIRDGRFRALAVTSERRTAALPEVPTVAEAGFEPIVDSFWAAMFFPAGTPRPVLERANADVRRALERPAFVQRLATMGFDPIGGDLAAAQAYVAGEIAKWRDIVRTVGVQLG